MATWQRTHTCGDLRSSTSARPSSSTAGHTYRSYNDRSSSDLRDRYGLTRRSSSRGPRPVRACRRDPHEWVLSVEGTVRKRYEGRRTRSCDRRDRGPWSPSGQILNQSRPAVRDPVDPARGGKLMGSRLAGEDLVSSIAPRSPGGRRCSGPRDAAALNKVIRDSLDRQGFSSSRRAACDRRRKGLATTWCRAG